MLGVKFGSKHSYLDYGLILNEKTIGSPAVKEEYISIPGRNGVLDLTEALTGYPVYSNRELKFKFTATEQTMSNWAEVLSVILADIHGEEMNIILDDDPTHYYHGRITVEGYVLKERRGEFTVNCDCEPFKYDLRPQFAKVEPTNALNKYVQLISDDFRGTTGSSDGGFIEIVGANGNCTVYGTTNFQRMVDVSLGHYLSITKDHKYYIRSGNAELNIILETDNGIFIGEENNEYILSSTSTRYVFPAILVFANGHISKSARPALVDLTMLFGAGNEPSDISDDRISALRSLLDWKHGESNEYAIVLNNGDSPAAITASVRYSDTEEVTTIYVNGNKVNLTYGRRIIEEELKPGGNIITFPAGTPTRTVMFEYTKGWL